MKSSDPKISIITPLYNPPTDEFRRCIESVLGQTRSDWQWCITDDGSDVLPTGQIGSLREDPRISFNKLDMNRGIAEATNDAIFRATGDFVAFLDQDDELNLDAIATLVEAIKSNPESDVLYSDEDKIDLRGQHFDSFRKPEWSPERLRHQNYLNHLTVMRRSLVQDVGYLNPEFDGSQDYDLVLRATEKARAVTHIPKILYHWRAIPSSVALDPNSKPRAHEAAVKAVAAHLQRLNIEADVSLNRENLWVSVCRKLTTSPTVSILIPSRGSSSRIHGSNVVLVENCVESILSSTSYENYEIIVILDSESPPSTREYLETRKPETIKVLPYEGEFNFSTKVNLGAITASGQILVPLNDDTQVVSDNWLDELLVYLQEDDVGLTAPLLLLENGLVQSAGHFFRHGAHHYAAGQSRAWPGQHGLMTFPAERSGATFACVAIKRSVYEEVGGLSEIFPRSFNDVDFCNKVRKAGYRIVWSPESVLYHFESLTRDPKVHPSEVERLYSRWGHVLSTTDEYLADVY